LLEQGQPSWDFVPTAMVASFSCRVDQMGNVLAEPNGGDRIESQPCLGEIWGVGELGQHGAKQFVDEGFAEVDLEIVEQADEVVFRGRHEGSLNIDHHESFSFILFPGLLGHEM
jgi:hypothetical protein